MVIASSAAGPCISKGEEAFLHSLSDILGIGVRMSASPARFASTSTFCVPASAPARPSLGRMHTLLPLLQDAFSTSATR